MLRPWCRWLRRCGSNGLTGASEGDRPTAEARVKLGLRPGRCIPLQPFLLAQNPGYKRVGQALRFCLSDLVRMKSVPARPQPSARDFGQPRLWEALRQRLRELGYLEGQNIAFEPRFAEGKSDRLSASAAELVELKVDAIVTSGTPAALAAKHATRTIPIVMAQLADPVGAGLVSSLRRPGGNITGLTTQDPDLIGNAWNSSWRSFQGFSACSPRR